MWPQLEQYLSDIITPLAWLRVPLSIGTIDFKISFVGQPQLSFSAKLCVARKK